MTPRQERLVALAKELTELVPAFPGTERAARFEKVQTEALKISGTLTPAQMDEVNEALGIFFTT